MLQMQTDMKFAQCMEYGYKEKGFWQMQFYSKKSTRFYSFLTVITSSGIPETILGFDNQRGVQELTESCYGFIAALYFYLSFYF